MGWMFPAEKFCTDFCFSLPEELIAISAVGFLAMGTEMSWTGSDSNQDDKGAHLSDGHL